jgi:hypothetical protein
LIQAIHGGGYLAKNNFSLIDLNDRDKTRLLEIKPQLADIGMQLYLGKVSNQTQQLLKEQHLRFESGYLISDKIELSEISNIVKFSDRSTEDIISRIDDLHQYDSMNVSVRDIAGDREIEKYETSIYSYIKRKYNTEDFVDLKEALNLLSDEDDELWDEITRAYDDAYNLGTEANTQKHIIGFISDNISITNDDAYDFIEGTGQYDSGEFIFEFKVTGNEDIITLLEEYVSLDLYIDKKLDLDRYDLTDFDEQYWKEELANVFSRL